MITRHWVLAGLAWALAFGPALASDNSKSKIDPKKLMDLTDEQQVPVTSGTHYMSAPNPNDTAYIDELYQQLAVQQAQVQQAQAALDAATAQLALAQQALPLSQQSDNNTITLLNAVWSMTQGSGTQSDATTALAMATAELAAAQQLLPLDRQRDNNAMTVLNAAWFNLQKATANFAIGQGSEAVVAQAQIAWNKLANLYGFNPADGISGFQSATPPNADQDVALLTQVVNELQGSPTAAQAQTAWSNLAKVFGFDPANGVSGFQALGPLDIPQNVALLTQAVAADQVALARAQAAVAATQALISAAQNGQSSQTSDAGNSDPSAQASDTQDLATLSAEGGSDYDAGDAGGDGGGGD